MTALGRKAIEVRLVAELRALPAGAKPHMGTIRKAIAAALGQCSPAELASAIQSLRYQGKLAWDGLELSASVAAPSHQPRAASVAAPSNQPRAASVAAPSHQPVAAGEQDAAPCAAEGGRVVTKHAAPPSIDAAGSAEPVAEDGDAGEREAAGQAPSSQADTTGPDDDDGPEEDYPGEVNDVAGGAPAATPAADPIPPPVSVTSAGFVSRKALHQAGVHAAATRAGARPIPPPPHEPEVARQVREESNELSARRNRARSTGTVRVPLELRKLGVPDLSFGEGVASLLVEQPHDLIAAVNRKHPHLWKRVILLGRAEQRRPAEALYAALEAGLDQLETRTEVSDAA